MVRPYKPDFDSMHVPYGRKPITPYMSPLEKLAKKIDDNKAETDAEIAAIKLQNQESDARLAALEQFAADQPRVIHDFFYVNDASIILTVTDDFVVLPIPDEFCVEAGQTVEIQANLSERRQQTRIFLDVVKDNTLVARSTQSTGEVAQNWSSLNVQYRETVTTDSEFKIRVKNSNDFDVTPEQIIALEL